MRFLKVCTAAFMALGLFAVAAPAKAGLVQWTVDSAQSFVRLNIPDQSLTLEGITINVRVRNANNATWSDAGGRRANLQGTIATNLIDGSSISFLGGAHALTAIEAGSFRPDPAAFDPTATNGDNPDGQYVGTGTAPSAYAARINANAFIFVNATLAYISFRDVEYDILSGALALDGGGNFAGGSNDFGIESALLDADGISSGLVGQPVPDLLNESLTGLTGLNTLGGVVTDLGGLDRQLTFNINVPIQIDLDGTILTASAVGQIVAFATIPEPSSVLLAGFAAFGLIWAGRRRIRRS